MPRNAARGGTAEGLATVIGYVAVTGLFIYFEFPRTFGLIMLGSTIALVVGLLIITGIGVQRENERAVRKRKEHVAALSEVEKKIVSIVSKHLDTLATRRDTLVRVDRYGVVDGKDWKQEVQHFAEKVVRPSLNAEEAQALVDAGINAVFGRLIENRVAEYCEARKALAVVPEAISRHDFEGLCAATLRQHGWRQPRRARGTKARMLSRRGTG